MFMGVDSYGDSWQGGYIQTTINDQEYGPYEVEESFGYFTFEIDLKACNWEIPGCTDKNAYNYNEFATIDDGTCISPSIFNWDKIDREYLLYTPTNLEDNAPLVFVFHGYGGDATGIMDYSEMNTIADENGFAVDEAYVTVLKQDPWDAAEDEMHPMLIVGTPAQPHMLYILCVCVHAWVSVFYIV